MDTVKNTKRYRVQLTLIQPMLGTVPKDPEVYASYIASKALEDVSDELETVQISEEKGWTGFHEFNGDHIIYDYMIKGHFKGACGQLRRIDSLSKKIRAYKRIIDGLVFVKPRRIKLELPEGGEWGVVERPLRAETAQGQRVALARSDSAPIGTKLTFEVVSLGNLVTEELLREWLDYGQWDGLGQWRSSGVGRFTYEMEEIPSPTM